MYHKPSAAAQHHKKIFETYNGTGIQGQYLWHRAKPNTVPGIPGLDHRPERLAGNSNAVDNRLLRHKLSVSIPSPRNHKCELTAVVEFGRALGAIGAHREQISGKYLGRRQGDCCAHCHDGDKEEGRFGGTVLHFDAGVAGYRMLERRKGKVLSAMGEIGY